jgi:hypothetical protein
LKKWYCCLDAAANHISETVLFDDDLKEGLEELHPTLYTLYILHIIHSHMSYPVMSEQILV